MVKCRDILRMKLDGRRVRSCGVMVLEEKMRQDSTIWYYI